MKIALLIPTYNEADNIASLLVQVAHYCQPFTAITVEIYVIDDNSPDQTARLVQDYAQRLQTQNFYIHLISRARKEGLGRAYIDGFSRVLGEARFDFIAQMDADLSHAPHYLPHFFAAAMRGVELIVASRYLPGAALPHWAWYRKALSVAGNWYARKLLGSQVTDYTGGFNMFSVIILRQMNLAQLDERGYGFLIKLKFLASRLTTRIENFPIIFMDRQAGTSKMPLNTLAKNFLLVLWLWSQKKNT